MEEFSLNQPKISNLFNIELIIGKLHYDLYVCGWMNRCFYNCFI